MPLVEHLEELRGRVIVSVAAWLAASALGYALIDRFILPLLSMPGIPTLYFTRPTEAFFVRIKIAMIAGLALALPVVLYQLLAFVLPGLMPRERRWLIWAIAPATVFFAAGVLFSYYLLLPVSLRFLMGFASQYLQPLITINEYLNFIIALLLVCGLLFEMPIVLVILAAVGVVSAGLLVRYRRHAYLIMVVLAAILTPTPDAFTLLLVSIPMVLLYELSVLGAFLVGARGKRQEMQDGRSE